MIVNLINKLDSITLSVGEIFFGFFLFISLLGLLYFMYKICKKKLDQLKRKGFLAFKSFLISLSPTLFLALALMDKVLPDKIYLFIFVCSIGIVFLWNVFSMGLFHGVLYTILNVSLGMLASIGFLISIALAIVGIGGLISSLGDNSGTGKMETGTSTKSPSSIPDYVTNVSTNEHVYVEKGINGNSYINGKVVRKTDYDNTFIDSEGNYYTSHNG